MHLLRRTSTELSTLPQPKADPPRIFSPMGRSGMCQEGLGEVSARALAARPPTLQESLAIHQRI